MTVSRTRKKTDKIARHFLVQKIHKGLGFFRADISRSRIGKHSRSLGNKIHAKCDFFVIQLEFKVRGLQRPAARIKLGSIIPERVEQTDIRRELETIRDEFSSSYFAAPGEKIQVWNFGHFQRCFPAEFFGRMVRSTREYHHDILHAPITSLTALMLDLTL